MGIRDKGRGKSVVEAAGEEDPAQSRSEALLADEPTDDEEDEANEDLSLKIVEKAILIRAARMTSTLRGEDASEDEEGGGVGGVVEDVEGTSLQGECVVVTEGKEERKEEAKNEEVSELSFIALNDEETPEEVKPAGAAESVDPSSVQMTDNAVLRKLLRGPRYFDAPDNSWGTCYNCGGEGHFALNCTAEKRKKPCFICGSLQHNVKQCKKANDCFICKKSGHRAKDCPEKQKGRSRAVKMCLKCGDSGHDMFSCTNNYPTEDLKGLQCYICKDFGHLCCVDPVNSNPVEVSCFKCGELGHTGLACGSAHERTANEATPGSCYKCGEGGHFARECRNSSKARASSSEKRHFAQECRNSDQMLTPNFSANCGQKGHYASERRFSTTVPSPALCYSCGEGGHFAKECRNSSKGCASILGGTTNGFTASFCYKCGEEGHFARECKRSNKLFMQTPIFCENCGEEGHFAHENRCPTKMMSLTLCYNCGQGGHFARECRSSFKGVKRENGLSTPGPKRSRAVNDYGGSNSMPSIDKESVKRKKMEKRNSSLTSPYKPKHRGGWITEDPGDFSRNYKKVQKSPSTYTKAYRNSTPSSQGSGKASRHDSWFRGIANDGTRRHYSGW